NSSSVACGASETMRRGGAANRISLPRSSIRTTGSAAAAGAAQPRTASAIAATRLDATRRATTSRAARPAIASAPVVAHAHEQRARRGAIAGRGLVLAVGHVAQPAEELPVPVDPVTAPQVEEGVAGHSRAVGVGALALRDRVGAQPPGAALPARAERGVLARATGEIADRRDAGDRVGALGLRILEGDAAAQGEFAQASPPLEGHAAHPRHLEVLRHEEA